MTTDSNQKKTEETPIVFSNSTPPITYHRHNLLRPWIILIAIVILILFTVALTLSLTVFKVRNPTIRLVSASLTGVAPQITTPTASIRLNLTLSVRVQVRNRNYASFRHGEGRSLLWYRAVNVGEAKIPKGKVPARGKANLEFLLTVMADGLGAVDVGRLTEDVLGGEVAVVAKTRIPGKISVGGIYKKHVVTVSDCGLTLGFPTLDVRRQECRFHTKF